MTEEIKITEVDACPDCGFMSDREEIDSDAEVQERFLGLITVAVYDYVRYRCPCGTLYEVRWYL